MMCGTYILLYFGSCNIWVICDSNIKCLNLLIKLLCRTQIKYDVFRFLNLQCKRRIDHIKSFGTKICKFLKIRGSKMSDSWLSNINAWASWKVWPLRFWQVMVHVNISWSRCLEIDRRIFHETCLSIMILRIPCIDNGIRIIGKITNVQYATGISVLVQNKNKGWAQPNSKYNKWSDWRILIWHH